MQWFGYNAPFIGGPEGVMSRQTNERLIRNDLLQLLLTSPGERVMRPEFGTGIRRFVFEDFSDESLDALRENILDIIAKYESRVNVTEVKLEPDHDSNLLQIKIYGHFNLDRFAQQSAFAGGMLVELGLPMNQRRRTGAQLGGVIES